MKLLKRIMVALLCLCTAVSLYAQNPIKGTVTDENGEPLIGAAIQNGKTGSATITDIDGNFTLKASKGDKLTVSFLGYKDQIFTVESVSGRMKIVLDERDTVLDESVVIGYGTRAKRDITTAVSNINSDKISSGVALSPELAMQGQMSGVQVIGNGGNPNSRPTIRIRGTNTWGVADPLIVIDGVPVKEYGAGVEQDDYVRGNINIMNMIDPNDIESISVLKDAASGAIYGVRAANGVVLITTKSGRKEKTHVDYSHKLGLQDLWQRVPVMDTKHYAEYFLHFFQTDPNWVTNIDEKNYLVFNPELPTYLGNNPTTDWQDATVNKQATTEDYSIRVSGGTDKTDYSLSLGYSNFNGVRIGNDLTRYTGAVKLNTEINKYMRMGMNFRLSSASSKHSPVPGLKDAAMAPPWQPIYDENGLNGYAGAVKGYRADGTWDNAILYGTMTRNNFIGQMSTQDETDSSLRMMGNIYFEIEPIKNLKIRGNASMDQFSNNITSFSQYDGSIFEYSGVNPTAQAPGSVGSYEERKTDNTNVIYELTASYRMELAKHYIDILVNAMSQRYGMKYMRGGTEYMTTINPALWNLGGENKYTRADGSQNRGALAGTLARVSYNYDYTYYLDLTVRVDGSARFAPAYRWGVFPGVSAAWRISKAPFMSGASKWIQDLKLRASWGELGNQEVRDMAYLSTIDTWGPRYTFGNNPSDPGQGYYASGATVTGMANEALKWERTMTSNVGLDFSVLDGLSGSIEYYHKMTHDILQPVKLPGSVGLLSQPVDNIAKVRNQGIELNLNYTKTFGDLTISAGGNFTTVDNKVVKMYRGIPSGTIEEGYSMNYLKGYVLGGMFQTDAEAQEYMNRINDISYKKAVVTAGDFWFKDLRSAPDTEGEFYKEGADGIVDSYDQVYLGKSIPGYYYGMNFAAEFKGIDLSAQFTGVGDVQKWNGIKQTFLNTSQVAVNQSPEIYNAWTPENTNTTIPRLRFGDPAGNNRGSSYFVEDADYLRLANLQLGYTLPKKVYDLTNNILSNCRIYFGIANVFTLTKWTGLDPESDGSPAPRTFYTGLNVRF